jgi:peroxiredoxin Q/BCP
MEAFGFLNGIISPNRVTKLKMKLQVGQPAPDFELFDAHKKHHRLSNYINQWLVLYFYPKDDTPGCTIEACKFRDDYSGFKNLDTIILGISLDDSKSHQLFSDKLSLPFDLLTDDAGEISKSYGTLLKLGPIKFCRRHSFIIDPQGKIAKIYRSVSPANHSQLIQQDIKALQEKLG